MKQAVLGVLAAIAMILGLAAAPTTATAAPYVPGQTVGTTLQILSVSPSVRVRKDRVRMVVRVNTAAGAGTPRGTVRVNCLRIAKGSRLRVYGPATNYSGGRKLVLGPRLPRKGRWACYSRFIGAGTWGNDTAGPVTVRAYRLR